jgi:arsenate reductase
MPDDRVYNVLFLCTGNSARSILAEVLLNQGGKGRFKAYSAGSFPKGEVNPHAIRLLETLKLPTDGLRSKSWDEFAKPGAPPLDFIITVCDKTLRARYARFGQGKPVTAHWGIPDPAAAEGSDAEIAAAFAMAARQLRTRIDLFLNLPLASIDRMTIQNRLKDIQAKASQSDNGAA